MCVCVCVCEGGCVCVREYMYKCEYAEVRVSVYVLML